MSDLAKTFLYYADLYRDGIDAEFSLNAIRAYASHLLGA